MCGERRPRNWNFASAEEQQIEFCADVGVPEPGVVLAAGRVVLKFSVARANLGDPP